MHRQVAVLVVEDNVACRELLTLVLEEAGVAVSATGTGHDAITLAHQRAFDVIFTDLGLPDMDGVTVVRQIVATALGRPRVVLVTGAWEDAINDALRAGADAVLTKPFDCSALVDHVRPPLAST